MSKGPVIPSDAIEAAADAIVAAILADSTDKYTYVSVGAAHRVQLDGAFDLRAAARAALVAAAPHLLAPVIQLADELEASNLSGDNYMSGRGSGFRMTGVRIRQVLGLAE